MSLNFKRNLPTVVLLVSILSYLAIFMGDQTITSYSFDTESLRTAIQHNLSSEELTALQMASMSQ
jgi:hypothetical protein